MHCIGHLSSCNYLFFGVIWCGRAWGSFYGAIRGLTYFSGKQG